MLVALFHFVFSFIRKSPTLSLLSAQQKRSNASKACSLQVNHCFICVRVGTSASPGDSVAVFVDGRPWRGPPAAVPLQRHSEIVLEVGPHVPPHAAYTFPPGM